MTQSTSGQPMGFPSQQIAPGSSIAIPTAPVQDVLVTRFTSPPQPGLVLHDCKVGTTSLMMANTESGVPLDVELDWYLETPVKLHAGAQAVCVVQNLSDKPVTFRGAVLWCDT